MDLVARIAGSEVPAIIHLDGGASREYTPPPDGRADIERAIADLAERLPAPLRALAEIVYNYRWSWLPGASAVFREISPDHWRHSRCKHYLIEAVPRRRLEELAAEPRFVARVQALAEHVRADLRRPWADTGFQPEHPVAYFCSEFGVHCSLPLYGGGLGVLAGDTLKAASDLALPMVGIGLLYREGYLHQRVDQTGWQQEYWTTTDFERLPVVLVTGRDGRPLSVSVTIRRRLVHIQIWRVDVGRAPLYLLDTDRDDNHPIDRWITARLYVGDRHTRLAQYLVLGVGGMRALDVLGIEPAVVHLNEGHGALGGLECLRLLLAGGTALADAMATVRRRTVFTTHTPLAAGNEWYAEEEMEAVLGDFLDEVGLPHASVYGLARVNAAREHDPVGLTPLALHLSDAANGVSRRHEEVARQMWHPLWPERAVTDVPIGHVTNGVHSTTWMAGPMQALLDQCFGDTWRQQLQDPALWERLQDIPDAMLWAVRCALRSALVEYARERSMYDRLGSRGDPPEYVESAAGVLDPAVLTVGFARRVVGYKRLDLLAQLPGDGLMRLLADGPRPVQFVLAGKAHPQDLEAKQAIRRRFELRHHPVVARRMVFLEDYDLHMAPRLLAGVDLWLNLPRPPLEASGTSGMKVALNGGLNLSVLDGWWAEAFDGENGWSIATPDGDPASQDAHDARALLELLEGEIIQLFYDRDAGGLPRRWLARVKHSMASLIPRFAAERMVREYIQKIYRSAHDGQ